MAPRTKYGITRDDAVAELGVAVADARNFVFEELEAEWARSEKYFGGEVDTPKVLGRSSAVKTEVRDIIRAILPSMMRVLLQARKIVEYTPRSPGIGDWTEQQALYVTQLFWRCGGYTLCNDALHDALKRGHAPMKAYWKEDPTPKYFKFEQIDSDALQELEASPNIDVQTITPITGAELNAKHDVDDYADDYVVYNVEGYEYFPNGQIVVDATPPEEFFISRDARSVEDAVERGVHGTARNVTVAEALELGLEADDWYTFDADDPSQNEHTESGAERRGYYRHQSDELTSADPLKHQFLLTTVYVKYDLAGTGKAQLYCFYLGGTQHAYIHHEEVEESPHVLGKTLLVEHEWRGSALAEELCLDQDVNSSILRAVIDNFHMSNAPRFAADPVRTNFEALVNHAAGAPIPTKGDPSIQVVSVPFTGQYGISILQYLDQEVQSRAGVTKAAQGLDPNAMQSTDAEAVKNTIALSQGRVELMVRNFIETGLIPLFRKMLTLSIRHMDPVQLVRTKGVVLPVPQGAFDPNLVAETTVGLGTASPEHKVQTLSFILGEQKAALEKYGYDNPVTSMAQMYNTMEDLTEAGGLHDVGRYFKVVTPDVEAQMARKAAEDAQLAQQNAPMDPSKAMLQIENVKAQVKQLEAAITARTEELKLQLEALKTAEELDIKRDELAQRSVDSERRSADQRDTERVRAIERVATAGSRVAAPPAPAQTGGGSPSGVSPRDPGGQ